jgi:hypothetical protein
MAEAKRIDEYIQMNVFTEIVGFSPFRGQGAGVGAALWHE